MLYFTIIPFRTAKIDYFESTNLRIKNELATFFFYFYIYFRLPHRPTAALLRWLFASFYRPKRLNPRKIKRTI